MNKNLSLSASQILLSLQKLDIDRTIGAVASLSLALGLYRFMSAIVKGKISDTRAWTLIRVLVGAALTKSSQSITSSGKFDSNRYNSESENSFEYIVVGGSCHCNSVCFKLRAPSVIKATVKKGKLHYPRHVTTATNFKLVSGAEYLSVYYVSVYKNDLEMVAGHTFCSRCGVHILRALDSYSDHVEINTDCLDDDHGKIQIKIQPADDDWLVSKLKYPLPAGNSNSNDSLSFSVFKDDGKELKYSDREEEQNMAWPKALATLEESSIAPDSRSAFVKCHSAHEPNYSLRNQIHQNIYSSDRGKTSTPTTSTSTHVNGDSFSRSGASFAEDDYFHDEIDQAASIAPSLNSMFTSPLSVGMQSAYTWSHSTNRIQPFQLSPLPVDDLSLDYSSPIPPPSIRMKDQLQHYMKKHITPPGHKSSREVKKKKKIKNDLMQTVPKLPI